MYIYSDREREDQPHALPDVEVFYVDAALAEEWCGEAGLGEDDPPIEPGWYWWSCSPGWLPDGDPNGPYDSEDLAVAHARETDGD